VLNELVTGPCYMNQKILTSKPLVEVYQIMSRILDDISHDFYELKHACLILIISLTEGFKKKIIREIAVRATPSILLNQIERLTKKLYINQLIERGNFRSEVRKKIDYK
jgi:hypothetical protein